MGCFHAGDSFVEVRGGLYATHNSNSGFPNEWGGYC